MNGNLWRFNNFYEYLFLLYIIAQYYGHAAGGYNQ